MQYIISSNLHLACTWNARSVEPGLSELTFLIFVGLLILHCRSQCSLESDGIVSCLILTTQPKSVELTAFMWCYVVDIEVVLFSWRGVYCKAE